MRLKYVHASIGSTTTYRYIESTYISNFKSLYRFKTAALQYWIIDYKGLQSSNREEILKRLNLQHVHLCFSPWLFPELDWHFRNLLNNEDDDRAGFWLLLYHACNTVGYRTISDLHLSRLYCQFSACKYFNR